MNMQTMNVKLLKALARECGIKGYYKICKAELIEKLNSDAPVVLRPVQAPRPVPAPRVVRQRPVPAPRNILDTKVPNIDVEPMKPIPFLKKITDIPQIVKTKTNTSSCKYI